MQNIDVFISRKSADKQYAQKLYEYLTAQGLTVFESDNTLKELSETNFTKSIYEMLDRTTHFIVIGSSAEHLEASWVQAEWWYFINRKNSGKTSGNLLTVVTSTLKIEEIPPSLASLDVIPYNEEEFYVIYNKVRQPNLPAKSAPPKPLISKQVFKWLLLVIILVSLTGIGYWIAKNYLLPQSSHEANNLSQTDSLNKTNITANSLTQPLQDSLDKRPKYNPQIHKEADVNLANTFNLNIYDTNIQYSVVLHNRTDASAKNLKVKFFLMYDDEYEEFDLKEPIVYIPKNTENIPLKGAISGLPIRKTPSEIVIYLVYDNETSPRKSVKKYIISEPKNLVGADAFSFIEKQSKVKIVDVSFLLEGEEMVIPERKKTRKVSEEDTKQRLIFKDNLANASLNAIGGYALYERRLWNELKKYSTKRFYDFVVRNRDRLLFETNELLQFELTYESEYVTLTETKAVFRMKPLLRTRSSRYWYRVEVFRELNLANGITPFKNYFDYGFEVAMVKENGEWKIDLHDEHNGIPDKTLLFNPDSQ